MEISEKTRHQITTHYYDHINTYHKVWTQLTALNDRFRRADTDEQIAFLKLSHANAVISVHTEVVKHEAALSRIMDDQDLKTALEPINYKRRKAKYIRQSHTDPTNWTTLLSQLEARETHAAHRTALNQLKGVGVVKSAFMLAELGFTEKMCVDVNVAKVMGIEESPTSATLSQYQTLCDDIYAEFPVLSEKLDPYQLQWVIFDWQRFYDPHRTRVQTAQTDSVPVTTHDGWFDAAFADPAEIQDVMQTLTHDAQTGEQSVT